LTCRDRNRIALQSDLLSAAASGVRNLLMLRGDDPSAGDQPDAKPVFDLDPRSLLETARRCGTRVSFPQAGRLLATLISFLAAPTTRSIHRPDGNRQGCRPRSMRAPSSSRHSSAWMRVSCIAIWRGSRAGLTDRLSFLIGVVPLRSAKSARWIKEKLFGAVIPDALIDRMEQATIRWLRAPDLRRHHSRTERCGRRCGRAYHGARERCGCAGLIKVARAGIGRLAPA
jgi:methylenetetrahydrofolate reductase (NADPH)